MAQFTKGTTYSSGSTVNASNLEALITAATVAGIDRFDCDRTAVAPATVSQNELGSPASEEVWIISNSSGDPQAMANYHGSEWHGLVPAFQAVYANEDIATGQVVTFTGVDASSRPKVSVADDSAPGSEIGVAAHNISSGDIGIIVISGVVNILFSGENGSANPGNLLSMSSTKGSVKVRYSTETDIQKFAQALRADSSGSVLAWLHR